MSIPKKILKSVIDPFGVASYLAPSYHQFIHEKIDGENWEETRIHEAGHALVAYVTPTRHIFNTISTARSGILPYGRATAHVESRVDELDNLLVCMASAAAVKHKYGKDFEPAGLGGDVKEARKAIRALLAEDDLPYLPPIPRAIRYLLRKEEESKNEEAAETAWDLENILLGVAEHRAGQIIREYADKLDAIVAVLEKQIEIGPRQLQKIMDVPAPEITEPSNP